MEKVLFIRPPEHYLPHRSRPMAYFSIGMLQIAAVLIEKGFEVEIVDGILPEREIKQGDNFFGITWGEMRERIEKKDFDIAGISAQFTFQWENASKMAQICKEVNPACKVIVGGAHASVDFDKILKINDAIDVVVRGEGEYVFAELVRRFRSNASLEGISGIAYRNNGSILTSEHKPILDLDALPFPAYHLIDIEKYFWLIKKYFTRSAYEFPGWERGVTLITSRGCPFSCVFCSIHLHMGRKWRAHSAEYVLKHIDYLIKNFKVKYLHFEDDNFTLDSGRSEMIFDGIIENNWNIRWDTPNGVRVDTFNESLLKKCRESGCTHLIFGIESGSQRVLDEVIKKSIKLPKVEEVLEQAKRIGVDTRAFYMMGLPGETKKDIRASVRYALKLMLQYECLGGFSMAVPMIGTEMYDICEKNCYFCREPIINNLSAGFLIQGIIKTEEFSPDFLKSMRHYFSKRAYLINFLLFFRKLIREPQLIKYVLVNIFRSGPSKWSSIYYKVICFHHALIFDMTKMRG